jgi:hypothetical protein
MTLTPDRREAEMQISRELLLEALNLPLTMRLTGCEFDWRNGAIRVGLAHDAMPAVSEGGIPPRLTLGEIRGRLFERLPEPAEEAPALSENEAEAC